MEISQEELMALAEKWEPEASQSSPVFRQATCVKCAEPMVAMWHLWLDTVDSHNRHWVKEIHLCETCGLDYE